MGLDMLPARALKNSQLTCGERHAISGTGHWCAVPEIRDVVSFNMGWIAEFDLWAGEIR